MEHISIGALQGIGGIKAVLHQAGPFRWVVDATHPFAARISHDLVTACAAISTNRCCVMSVPLNRLELPHWWLMPRHWPPSPLQGQRLLLAIGGRHLPAFNCCCAPRRSHPLWPCASLPRWITRSPAGGASPGSPGRGAPSARGGAGGDRAVPLPSLGASTWCSAASPVV